MNIQIFGTSKSFDTKKAERWFKERRIKFQSVDVRRYGMSRGELASVRQAVGLEAMIDPKHPDAVMLSYLASDQAKLDHLFEDPSLHLGNLVLSKLVFLRSRSERVIGLTAGGRRQSPWHEAPIKN